MLKAKQGLLISVIILLLVSAVALFFYIESQKELKAISSLKPQIDLVTAKRIHIVKDIESSRVDQDRLVSRLQQYSQKIQDYESEIPAIRSERENMIARLTEAGKELSGLSDRLNEISYQESSLKEELEKAGASHEVLLEALEYASVEKSELEEKLKSYIQKARGVQLPKIVVKVARPAEGSIVETSKRYNFSVVDLGEINGINSGDLLEVYRDNRLIAKALVENVYDDMSSIIVFNQWRDVELVVGDTVKLQRS